MGKCKPFSVIGFALDILQIGFAITVIVVTGWKLLNVDIEGLDINSGLNINSGCLLDGSGSSDAISGTRFCAFVIGVAAASLLVSAIFGCLKTITKCVTLNVCKISKLVSLIGDTALGIGWTVAFVLILQRGRAANDLGWPERPARDGVIAASFGAAAAFYADVIVTVCSMVF